LLQVIIQRHDGPGGPVGAEAEGERPAAGLPTLKQYLGLIGGNYRNGLPVLAPSELDGNSVVGLEPGGQLDQPEAWQRLLGATFRLTAGQDGFPVDLGNDIAGENAGLGCRTVGSDRLDVG